MPGNGVFQIVVRYDRPVTVTTVQVVGIVSGDVTADATLAGDGTVEHILDFAAPLAGRDLYTVTVTRSNTPLVQWDFATLVGDCNQDKTVNILVAAISALVGGAKAAVAVVGKGER